jgi:Protein of unknown function (DUF3040)
VSLRRRQQRILDLIERDLAHSDPGLHAFYQGLSRRSGGVDMRWVEKIPRRLFGIFPRRRRGERSLGERAKNWTAENWKDP